jgi:hypothetical protein
MIRFLCLSDRSESEPTRHQLSTLVLDIPPQRVRYVDPHQDHPVLSVFSFLWYYLHVYFPEGVPWLRPPTSSGPSAWRGFFLWQRVSRSGGNLRMI